MFGGGKFTCLNDYSCVNFFLTSYFTDLKKYMTYLHVIELVFT
jgi:hypothetical protein